MRYAIVSTLHLAPDPLFSNVRGSALVFDKSGMKCWVANDCCFARCSNRREAEEWINSAKLISFADPVKGVLYTNFEQLT